MDHAIARGDIRLDGQLKWKVDNGDKCDHGGYSGARATPTIDGPDLYLLSGNDRLGSFDARSGGPRGSKGAREFGGSCGGWGYAESVLISGDWAIFKPGGEVTILRRFSIRQAGSLSHD